MSDLLAQRVSERAQTHPSVRPSVVVQQPGEVNWIAVPPPNILGVIDIRLSPDADIEHISFVSTRDLTMEQAERLLAAEVTPRLDGLVLRGDQRSPWSETALGHLQLTLVEYEEPML